MTNRTGRGRPNAAAYVTSWGQTIDGAYKGSDNKLRPIGRSKPAYSLNDELRAIHKFNRWQSEQVKTDQPEVSVSMPNTIEAMDVIFGYEEGKPFRPSIPATFSDTITTDVDSIRVQERNRLRQLLMIDPKQAAVEFDIPHLAFHPEVPDKPQYELIELGATYIQNKKNKLGKPLDKKYKDNLGRWWNEFLKIIGKPIYARDITKSMIVDYYHLVMDKLPDNSPAYIKCRFSAIKAIFFYGISFTEDGNACRTIHEYCKILVAPPQKSKPKPMSIEHYQKLLSVAKLREKAILIFGLNCAMHSGEVASTLRSECDFNDRTFAADRNKTGIPRVAKLWQRTIDAINEYHATIDFESKYLFPTRTGSIVSVQQLFLTLRKNAKLPKSVTFEGIRDGAYTKMFTVNAIYARWVGGHASWTNEPTESKDITTKYVERDANNPNVIDCCEAVEKHYFG